MIILQGGATVGQCVGKGSKRGQCHCRMTSGGLPGPRPISSYFIYFPYVIGACPAAVLVVVPGGGGLMHVLPVSSTTQPPVGLQSEVLLLYFSWCWRPVLHRLAWGWAHLLTKCPPDFYPAHMMMGLPRSSHHCHAAIPLQALCHHRVLSSPTPCLCPSYTSG